MAELYKGTLASYKDSWQSKVEMENKDVGLGIVISLPRVYARELEHHLVLVVSGPGDAADAVRACLAGAVLAGMLAAIASAFTGAGMGAVSAAAFEAALDGCLGGLGASVQSAFSDDSRWSEWHPV